MCKSYSLIFILSIVSCGVRAQELKPLQSYVDTENQAVFYNMIRISDDRFLLLKDSKPLQDSINDQQKAVEYLDQWWKAKQPVDGKDYFIFEKNDFNSIEGIDQVAVDGKSFSIKDNTEYKIRWNAPYKAKLQIGKFNKPGKAEIALSAILYCCMNHTPQHCGEKKQKLKETYNCTTFEVKY
jgi:hypothetical protein